MGLLTTSADTYAGRVVPLLFSTDLEASDRAITTAMDG